MSESNPAGGAPNGAPNGTQGGEQQAFNPQLQILTQYIVDLSFENPLAPDSLRGDQSTPPSINVNVDAKGRPLGEDVFEAVLTIAAEAKRGDDVVFIIELTYGGVFRVSGVPQEHMQAVVLIEGPRLLFPFARRVLSDVTRDGGFPPLMVDPIDFGALYRARRQYEAQQAAQGGGDNGGQANA